jgi:hypothetical protein
MLFNFHLFLHTVDPHKESGQNLYRQYAGKKGKIVLNARWVHECVKAGALQTFHSNWANCKVLGTEQYVPEACILLIFSLAHHGIQSRAHRTSGGSAHRTKCPTTKTFASNRSLVVRQYTAANSARPDHAQSSTNHWTNNWWPC